MSQDTNICLWDLTEELLKSSAARHWAREGARQDRAREGKVGARSIVSFLHTAQIKQIRLKGIFLSPLGFEVFGKGAQQIQFKCFG